MVTKVMVRDAAPRHKSYILRLWETRGVPVAGAAAWRFSLEDLESSERHGFSSLDDMVSFLDRATGDPPRASAPAIGGTYPEDPLR